MQLPPLKSLWYFKHAAELGSFKLAAEQLFVSQAAVSQQIRLLEQQLDCNLFTRHTRYVELTRQGEQLLPHVLKGFSHLQAGVQAVSQDSHPNTLNLTVLPSFASGWLLGRISDFQNKYPHIKVRIEPSDQLADFSAGQVDLGIRFGQGSYPGLHSELISDDSLFLAYKPGAIDTSKSLKNQVLEQKLIKDICPDAERGWLKLADELAVSPDALPSLVIDNAALVIQATLAGQGIALVRRRLIESQLLHGQLEIYPDFEYHCQYKYYLAAPLEHFKWQKVQLFKDWLQKQFAYDDQHYKSRQAKLMGNKK